MKKHKKEQIKIEVTLFEEFEKSFYKEGDSEVKAEVKGNELKGYGRRW